MLTVVSQVHVHENILGHEGYFTLRTLGDIKLTKDTKWLQHCYIFEEVNILMAVGK